MAQSFRGTTNTIKNIKQYGTVISTDDAVYELRCQHGTVNSMDDALNQSKCLHGTVISKKDEEKQTKEAFC